MIKDNHYKTVNGEKFQKIFLQAQFLWTPEKYTISAWKEVEEKPQVSCGKRTVLCVRKAVLSTQCQSQTLLPLPAPTSK